MKRGMGARAWLVCALAPLAFVPGLAAQKDNPAGGLVLANKHARFEFEPGGMGLAAMVDLHSGKNHIRPAAEPRLLWEAAFAMGDADPPDHQQLQAVEAGSGI